MTERPVATLFASADLVWHAIALAFSLTVWTLLAAAFAHDHLHIVLPVLFAMNLATAAWMTVGRFLRPAHAA